MESKRAPPRHAPGSVFDFLTFWLCWTINEFCLADSTHSRIAGAPHCCPTEIHILVALHILLACAYEPECPTLDASTWKGI